MTEPLYVVYDTFTGDIKGITPIKEDAETWGFLEKDFEAFDRYIVHKVTNLNLKPKRQ